MGNLEKAGVLVVVALLAVILVVAFLNFPDTGKAAILSANAPKVAAGAEFKKANPKPEPSNIYAKDSQSDLIKPRTDGDRLATDPPPRLPEAPLVGGTMGSTSMPPNEDAPKSLTDMNPPKPEPAPREEKKAIVPPAAAPAWPKHVKVQSGESLWTIAVREYGPKLGPRMVAAITDANPSVRPEALKAGTDLTMPAPPGEPTVASKAEPAPKTATPGGAGKSSKAPPASKPARKLPFVPE